jgi:hypothetical protein
LDILLGFNADKNIIDILIANTTNTGANISLIIFGPVKFHISQSEDDLILNKSLNTANSTIIGDAAITIHNIQILAIKTIAKATKGKNSTIAKNNLIINSKKSDNTESPGAGEVIVEKSNKDEYIVMNGPTNHLDLSNNVSIV